MKKTLVFVSAMIIGLALNAQVITSVSNGNWLLANNWDCNCTPMPGDTVLINHAITLSVSWGYSSGRIEISETGSLTQSTTNNAMVVTGTGTFSNLGTFSFSIFGLSNCGPSDNSGTFNNIDSLFIDCSFSNLGTINALDFLSDNNFYNYGTINANNLLNNGNFSNNGTLSLTNLYNNNVFENSLTINFFNHTNAGEFTNNSIMNGSGNMHNKGLFNNQTSSQITVNIDFSNVDSTSHGAQFINNGHVSVLQDFTNTDTLDGSSTGQFCVGQNSLNSGVILGSFDFCDQTPTASNIFDLNNGNISNGITSCIVPCNSSINLQKINTVKIYPNPANNQLNFSLPEAASVIRVYNSEGKLCMEKNVKAELESLNINSLNNGLYYYQVISAENIVSGTFVRE